MGAVHIYVNVCIKFVAPETLASQLHKVDFGAAHIRFPLLISRFLFFSHGLSFFMQMVTRPTTIVRVARKKSFRNGCVFIFSQDTASFSAYVIRRVNRYWVWKKRFRNAFLFLSFSLVARLGIDPVTALAFCVKNQ